MQADLILRGGRIRPLGSFGPRRFPNLAVAAGRVLAVGGDEVLGLGGRATRTVDLAGASVLPGFNDPHAHVVYFGLSSFGADLTGCRTLGELQGRLGRTAAALPAAAWCLGRGYSETELEEGRAPTRWELDAVTGGRPAFVDHRGGHSRVANTAALLAAGITADSPDPVGGSIGRGPDGQPDGRLLEAAMRLVSDHQPPPAIEQRREGILRCQRLLLSRGITSTGAAVNRGFADDLRAFQQLAEEGRLRVRVNEFLSWELLPALRELGLATGSGDGLVRLGPVKVFVDGGASRGTAAMRTGGGTWRTSPEELKRLVGEANGARLQVAAHCVGDGAIEAMLDAVEAAQAEGVTGLRHRVEHCSVCPPDLRARMGRLGVIAVMQPLFATFGRERLAAQFGADLVPDVAPHAALLAAGVTVAFSSDLPVTPDPNPWLGIRAAVHDPLQGISMLEAVRAYTQAGAFTSFEEGDKGTLEPGRVADLQVYRSDPFEFVPTAPRPDLVLVGGSVAFRRRPGSAKIAPGPRGL